MQKFEYKLIKARRRTICLSIRDGQLIVRAPFLTPAWYINRFLDSKSDWIEKHLRKTQVLFKRQYKEGEKFLFLGRELELKIIMTNLKKPEIETNSLNLTILTYDDSKKFLRLQIERFYKDRTREIVLKLIKKYEPDFSGSACLPARQVTIKPYKSKWGSCTGKNDLSFNSKLAMTPMEVIEYVVIHELCHIKQKNHSKNFWQLVGSIDGEYNKRRKWLRRLHDKLVL